jgi:anti-anti-sigma regulatory factor
MLFDQHGFEALQDDGKVIVTISREFDLGIKRDQWSQALINCYKAESYKAVVVELGRCPIISSSVIAGLVHLHDHYWKRCPDGVILRHPSKHVVSVLEMMHLRQLFNLEDVVALAKGAMPPRGKPHTPTGARRALRLRRSRRIGYADYIRLPPLGPRSHRSRGAPWQGWPSCRAAGHLPVAGNSLAT